MDKHILAQRPHEQVNPYPLIADPHLRVTEVDLHLMARRRFEADRRSVLCL